MWFAVVDLNTFCEIMYFSHHKEEEERKEMQGCFPERFSSEVSSLSFKPMPTSATQNDVDNTWDV